MVKSQKVFPLRLETRQGCPLSSFFFNMILEGLAKPSRQEKNERCPNWKEKMSLFVDDIIIIYTENFKDSPQKTLELTDEFSQFERYKTNIHLLCFYTLITNYQKVKLRK